jgi:MraZ protein
VFQGTSALSLDGKGRLAVPVRHRDALSSLCNNQLTLTKHSAGCLLVFPRGAWAQFRQQLMQLPMGAEGWRRLYLGSAVDVEIDSAARVLVPPELRAFAKLDKELCLVGMGSRLELWDAELHQAQEQATLASAMPDVVQNFVL